jgi:hypothetical protein
VPAPLWLGVGLVRAEEGERGWERMAPGATQLPPGVLAQIAELEVRALHARTLTRSGDALSALLMG